MHCPIKWCDTVSGDLQGLHGFPLLMIPFSVKCDYVQKICVVSGRKIGWKMPNDAVSLVTTGIGVSVLAGILSGVCYVISYGFGPGKRYVFVLFSIVLMYRVA